MNTVSSPSTESERLKTLLSYQILDTPNEPAFDDLTALASAICGARISAISLIDSTRQWFKSAHGVDASVKETPREISICQHTIYESDLFVVPDASKDERFANSPLVHGEMGLRFYAGAQLIAPNGHSIGALCVADSEPRNLTDQQKAALTVLARQVMAQIELRNAHRQLTENFRALQQSSKLVVDYQQKLAETSRLISLEQMSSGVAHEINNPLAIIVGRTELLLDTVLNTEPLHPEALATDLRTILQTSTRMTTIVAGLRTFARDASAEKFSSVSLKTLITDTLALCTARLVEKSIVLTVDLDDVSLYCRPVQISQILINLLNNAYDAVAELPQPRWIHIRGSQSKDGVELSVTDSGSGIQKSVADKIMQPFYTTKEPGKGTGLGLSISCGLAKSHQGSLELDANSPNTKFNLYVPHKQAA